MKYLYCSNCGAKIRPAKAKDFKKIPRMYCEVCWVVQKPLIIDHTDEEE